MNATIIVVEISESVLVRVKAIYKVFTIMLLSIYNPHVSMVPNTPPEAQHRLHFAAAVDTSTLISFL